MHLIPPGIAPPGGRTPNTTRLLLHSRRTHDSYNGARHLPLSTWVRSPTTLLSCSSPDCCPEVDHVELVYEVVLFYGRNRACTILRTRDDFARLSNGLPPWEGRRDFFSSEAESELLDARALDGFLRDALARRKGECALEFFLRRRMEDCGGRC